LTELPGRGVANADVRLGILLLEAAVNVVLPPNGDAWVKLRNDDFSDLPEHYTAREGWSLGVKHEDAEGEPLPVLSERILAVIKGMMVSDPTGRLSLEEVMATKEMERLAEWKAAGERGSRVVKPALEEEGEGCEEEEEKWVAALTA
jgi:mitosis inhibitor protein kinase SWE1